MSAYYNEIDPYAVQWLKNLIAAGLIADGEVDDRSIEEVSPDDLKGFTQCHFFAGIGGWSLAARFAGWADDEPLWTGSCPCQPFSAAGKRGGTNDERHLWPVFFRLIKECRPSAVAGEQVASKLGYEWLTGVRSDLESEGYAVGAVDLCAASVGAPHIRQRMWWVADSGCGSFRDSGLQLAGTPREVQEEVREQRVRSDIGNGSSDSGVADPGNVRSHGIKACDSSQGTLDQQPRDDADGRGLVRIGMADPENGGRARSESERWEKGEEPDRGGSWMGDTDGFRRAAGTFTQRSVSTGEGGEKAEWSNPREETWGGRTSSWSGIYIPCADGKARRIEPSIEPLAHGVSNRMGRLRAYGNAIVPQVAAEVLKAWRGNGRDSRD
jgi:DNA (cytosine-5)-methyltransferase 1